MADRYHPAANQGSSAAPQIKVLSPYPPCIRAMDELDPITISQMAVGTQHRGKRLVVRVFGPPIRDVALVTCVEDDEGTITWLSMSNQPDEAVVPAQQTIRQGRCYMIKEPFAVAGGPDDCMLRVDHPSDVFLLPVDHELVPAKWRKIDSMIGRSVELRMKGNEAVGKKRWAEAEAMYTTAARVAETAEEMRLAYLNRSLANLRLGRPATALADAVKSYEGDDSARSEKGLFREASALYELAKYDQCLDRLQALRAAYPTTSLPLTMIDRARARLQEQEMGQYDFRDMYKQAEATLPLIDCATYTMPVEIKDSPGKGRGVFTTRNVLAGELLICEKAFGYLRGGENHPHDQNMKDFEDLDMQARLCAQVVQKLLHNIEDARWFGDLYHGDYNAASVYEVDGKPVVDSCLVGRVITLTNYRAPITCLSTLGSIFSGDLKAIEESHCTIGIWSFISYINHSCVSNVERSFIGDMQIIRATRDLEAGTELLVSYKPPLSFESYDEAQKRLSEWGFVCDCALCLDRKATPERVLLERKSLSEEAARFAGTDIIKAQRALDRLNQTYSAAARKPGAIRMEIWPQYIVLGKILSQTGKSSKGIEMTLRGLEALGFVISATPPRGDAKSSKHEFHIAQWGHDASFIAIDALRTLHEAYKKTSPENATAVRGYLELAYTMFVGEKETILDTYPEIA